MSGMEAMLAAQKSGEHSKVQYSIRYNIVDVNGRNYDTVVELDKTVPNNVLSNSEKLFRYVLRNFAGVKIPVMDENGNTEILEFAGPKETVKKGKNSHPVLGELGYIKGDTRKKIVVNLIEVASVSEHDQQPTTDNLHGWLDHNGWTTRKAYVLSGDGMIYEAYLKIAKSRDGRNILYGVNADIKKGIAVDESATQNKSGVLAAMSYENTVTQPESGVNNDSTSNSDRIADPGARRGELADALEAVAANATGAKISRFAAAHSR